MQASRRILLAFHLPQALRDLLEGISDYVKHSGKSWQVECVEPRDFYAAFRRRLVHGAITALGPRSRGIIHRLSLSPTPVVNVLRDLHPQLPSVLSDNRAIGRAGAQYLMQRGFRQCAFIGVDTPWSRDRLAGFSAALREAGLPPPLTLTNLRLTDFEYAPRVRAVRLLRRWIRKFLLAAWRDGCRRFPGTHRPGRLPGGICRGARQRGAAGRRQFPRRL